MVEDFSPGALKAIGALEFLAAVGLIVPAVLGIAPVLVPLAASGAVLLFAGAVIMRLRRGERATIMGDLVHLAMAAFVAWGRFGPGSFTRLTQRAVFSRARLRRMPEKASRTAVGSFPTWLRGADRTVGSGRFARRIPYQRRTSRTAIGRPQTRSRHSGSPALRNSESNSAYKAPVAVLRGRWAGPGEALTGQSGSRMGSCTAQPKGGCGMRDEAKAMQPEEVTRLVAERLNARDAAGGSDVRRGDPAAHRQVREPCADLDPLGRQHRVRVQVLRRQPDGSWLRIIDRPEIPQP
jgi:DoxX-like family